ncbi:MAG: hypothetical protein RR420_00940 [Anaerovoracaceae bacterium]
MNRSEFINKLEDELRRFVGEKICSETCLKLGEAAKRVIGSYISECKQEGKDMPLVYYYDSLYEVKDVYKSKSAMRIEEVNGKAAYDIELNIFPPMYLFISNKMSKGQFSRKFDEGKHKKYVITEKCSLDRMSSPSRPNWIIEFEVFEMGKFIEKKDYIFNNTNSDLVFMNSDEKGMLAISNIHTGDTFDELASVINPGLSANTIIMPKSLYEENKYKLGCVVKKNENMVTVGFTHTQPLTIEWSCEE